MLEVTSDAVGKGNPEAFTASGKSVLRQVNPHGASVAVVAAKGVRTRAQSPGGVAGRWPRRRLRCHGSNRGDNARGTGRGDSPGRPLPHRCSWKQHPPPAGDYSLGALQEGGRMPLLARGDSVSCPWQAPPRPAGLCRPPRRSLPGQSVQVRSRTARITATFAARADPNRAGVGFPGTVQG